MRTVTSTKNVVLLTNIFTVFNLMQSNKKHLMKEINIINITSYSFHAFIMFSEEH